MTEKERKYHLDMFKLKQQERKLVKELQKFNLSVFKERLEKRLVSVRVEIETLKKAQETEQE